MEIILASSEMARLERWSRGLRRGLGGLVIWTGSCGISRSHKQIAVVKMHLL